MADSANTTTSIQPILKESYSSKFKKIKDKLKK